MRGRQEGMSYAMKIAKEGGLEALEKEIKYRNIENYWYMGLNKKETKKLFMLHAEGWIASGGNIWTLKAVCGKKHCTPMFWTGYY